MPRAHPTLKGLRHAPRDTARIPRRTSGRLPALTLVEAIVSIGIVSLLVVAALQTASAARLGQHRTAVGSRALILAEDLMEEILQQRYADAADGPDSFGLSSSESATGDRSLFDDVDDYDGWTASPPQQKDGTEWTGLDAWGRTVEVDWVSLLGLDTASKTNTGVKRIVITVTHNGVVVATLRAYRTAVWPAIGDKS